jgi:hypothetical protein
MTKHIYSIGQSVRLGARAGTNLDPTEIYTVTALLPPVGVELQYRIRNEREKHERVAVEHLMRSVEPEKASSAAESRLARASEMARVFEKLL